MRRLLDLCDDLHRLRERIVDPETRRETRTRLRRQAKRKSAQLAQAFRAYRFRGPFGTLLRDYELAPEHFQVLAFLLHRHLCSEDPALEGRLLLSAVHENSFDVLRGLELLQETSPLRASGLVEIEDDDEAFDDLLEARFLISEEAIAVLQGEAAGVTPDDQRRGRLAPYQHHRELLSDLRVLHNLYKLRSERVFSHDSWHRTHAPVRPARSLDKRIRSYWTRVLQRLERTEGAETFPVVRLMRTHGLGEEELMVVVHLLFRELYEGNAYADVAELLRLVAGSEDELIRLRRLFQPASGLLRAEILHVESMIEGRPLTGEVHLHDWVVNELFGVPVDGRGIGSDERLDWHLYLQRLDDAGTFFRDLEANN